jgi:diguanylate cyclase (GGDEF)-like protein
MGTIFFGFLIYILVVNSTISTRNTLLLTIGTVYLFVGFLDFTHAISFDGLNYIFNTANESAQVWVASRFLEATGFLIALTMCRDSERCFSSFVKVLFALIAIGSIASIVYLDLPLFIDLNGPTVYMIVAESFIIFMFLISVIRLFMIDGHLTGFGSTMMLVLLLKIAVEVITGYYYNSLEMLNVLRYILRVLSYGALYMLVVKEVLQNPQQSIYNKFAKQHNELLRLSQIDQLTKIYNHQTSFLKIDEFLEKHRKDKLVYLAMIDIDDFKEVNDTYGHQYGDKILARLSRILYHIDLGNNERIVGRYGGDEFIVAGTVDSKSQIPAGFKKFSDRIKEEFKDSDIPITCSVGLTFSNPTDTVKDLVYKADIKMYESKQKGKNQITYEDERN